MHKLMWLMPNKKYNKTGIYKYNNELIKILKVNKNIDIKYCGSKNNYISTFLNKFFILPIILLLNSKKYDSIIYPEEGFAFLNLFSCSKENKIFIHDYRFEFNNFNKISLKEYFKQIYLNVNFLFLNKFNKIIVPSKYTKKLLEFKFKKLKKKIFIVPNIIDKKNYKTKKMNTKFYFLEKLKRKNKTLVLTIASNESRKNIKLVDKLSKIDKNFVFILVGKHKSYNNSNIFIFNDLNDIELSSLFNLSNIYLNTSLFEGFGRTSVEAQSFNLPVVCYDTKINRETLANSAHYIKKHYSLKKIIYEMKKLRSLNRKKGKDFKNSKRFLPKNILSKYKNNINEI